MSLERKLLKKYFSEERIDQIQEERMSPLRKYITSIGMDWKKLSLEQLERIRNSQAYNEFRKLNTIKYKYNKSGPVLNALKYNESFEEDYSPIAPKEYEPSKKYKHTVQKHIARQQYYAGLINKGYSALKTAPLYKSLGPKGFKARKTDVLTFKKTGITPTGKTKVISSITKRELHKKKSIPKLNHIKEIKPENEKQCEKEFEITKTLSGESSDTNTIQINPNMKIIKKSDKDKEIKKEQIKKPASKDEKSKDD